MVENVPSHSDFAHFGIRYLNLGWSMAIKVWKGTIPEDGYELDETELAEYHAAAEPEIASALSLVQQGAEFLLKSKIAEVSPWLLVRGDPKEWPKPGSGSNLSFADFRTLDAQDLLKVCDTFLRAPMPVEFVTAFTDNRKKRNTIMHSVGAIQSSAVDVVRYVLLVSEILIGPKKWAEMRRLSLLRDRELLYFVDAREYVMATECNFLAGALSPADLKRHYGYDRRCRSYLCPICRYSQDEPIDECRIAQLHPRGPASNTIYCFACGETTPVIRRQCTHCEGNVIWEETDVCLSCGND